jgi:hypothetical protein
VSHPRTLRASTAIVVLAIVVLQVAAVFNPRVVEVDHEEMFNAGQAWALLNGHAADLFRLQYREFCGGCTADALLATPLFALFGPRWLVWKLVPVAYTVLTAVVGMRVLARRVNMASAWAFGALLVLPPRTWLHLSLIGWGNHYEAGMVATCGLLVLADVVLDDSGGARARLMRSLAAGLLLGGAVWIGFSGVFGVAAAMVVLVVRRQWRLLVVVGSGIGLGLAPWALQYLSTGQHPFVTIYEEGESVPLLTRIPHKLHTLLAPRQLAALFGVPTPGWGHALGWGWAAALAVGLGVVVRWGRGVGRVVAVGLGAWTGIYLLVRFQVAEPPPPALAVPGSCRYAAPLYPLSFGVLAASVGLLWDRGNRRAAGAVLVLPLMAGLAARVEAFTSPFPASSVWTMHAVDWPYFRNQFSYVVSTEDHLNPATSDPFLLGAHAYGAARETASGLLRDDRFGTLATLPERPPHLPERGWWQGVGDALGSFHQNRLDGTLAILRTSRDLLDDTPGANDETRRRALRSVAAWQMHAADSWIRAIDRHDAGTFTAVHAALDDEPAELADAGWWAVGFTWAHHVAGWHQPVPLQFPPDPEGLPPAFVEGVAFALAEEWGPLGRLTGLTGLPDDSVSREAFAVGWADGLVDRWLGDARVPPLD